MPDYCVDSFLGAIVGCWIASPTFGAIVIVVVLVLSIVAVAFDL